MKSLGIAISLGFSDKAEALMDCQACGDSRCHPPEVLFYAHSDGFESGTPIAVLCDMLAHDIHHVDAAINGPSRFIAP